MRHCYNIKIDHISDLNIANVLLHTDIMHTQVHRIHVATLISDTD